MKISGNRNTELKPIALWIAPHQTRTRMAPPTAFDSTQARPHARAFHHEMAKFSARMSRSQMETCPVMEGRPWLNRLRAD